MANQIDYASVKIPDDKSPAEYHYSQRRAELLDMILQAGSPYAISRSQRQLAQRYDVSQGQISQDIDALGEYVGDNIGDRARLTTRAAFDRIFTELLETMDGDGNQDWRAKKAAWDVLMDFNKWLGDIGEQERAPSRSEIDMDVNSRHAELAYRVEHVVEGGDQDSVDDTASIEFDDVESVEGFTAEPPNQE